MNQQTEKRVISFIGTIARRCTRCLRKSDENCRNCISLWANSIMIDIDADLEGKRFIDRSLGTRTEMIIMQLTRANKPLLSSEIDMHGVCSFQLKLWTLKRLCKRGIIGRKIARSSNGHRFYFYYLKNKQGTNKHENHVIGNQQLQAD